MSNMICAAMRFLNHQMDAHIGWGSALVGLGMITMITPGLIIKNAAQIEPKPTGRIVVPFFDDKRIPEHLLPLKTWCTRGDDYWSDGFNLNSYIRAKAVSRKPTEPIPFLIHGPYVIVPASIETVRPYIPKPRPRPELKTREDWLERISKSTKKGAEKLINDTKELAKQIGDFTKRTVSGNGKRMILEPRTAKMFVELERRWGERLHVRWAYRDKNLNRKVGGRPKSYHLTKQAVDIVHGGWSKNKVRRFVKLAYSIGFRGFGMGGNVIHLDSRGSFTSWNYGGNVYGLAGSMVGR